MGGGKDHLLRIKVAPTGMRDSTAEAISAKDGIPAGLNGVSYVFGDLYAGINNDQNIYRWDRAAHKFVVDNRLQLHLDVPKATPQVYEAPDGSVWSVMLSSDARRVARVTRNADGTFHLDEDTYKPLTRYKDLPTFVDPDGSVWETGDSLLRFDPRARTTVADLFPVLVRQVNAGPTLVYGGTEMRDGSELRLPAGSSRARSSLPRLCTATRPTSNTNTGSRAQTRIGRHGASKRKLITVGWVLVLIGSTFVPAARTAEKRRSSYAFTILPPWYRTTLAYIGYVFSSCF